MAKDMEVESGVDRISALPEGVICHILSFLPTKVAVQTSVLSTKWRKIYTLVSSIDLEFGLWMMTERRLMLKNQIGSPIL
ncbi:hypothetical protein SLEP1_g26447 [Rubroshorea leprosula]|uniref:F-box domain-containing protein n=1 Tax=Rubroshorea leprosula TaxID=152421 RepID=A0AAV5JWD7_9ROSI|nr:hypothetical protein SLEP1_g26447 [Rubroshorea leprosula]